MPARSARPLIKIHFRIYKDTYEALLRMATPEMGHNAIARNVLDKFVKQAEDHIRQRIDEVEGRRHDVRTESEEFPAPLRIPAPATANE